MLTALTNLDRLVHFEGAAMSFQDKTVLVTGGTSGIGRATAELFAQGGADVVISGRDAARGREVVDAIESAGGKARFVAADLSAPDSARQLAEAAGDVDILINNAAIFPFGPTHELPIEDLRAVLEVNVTAPFALTAALVPAMLANGGGAIVNVSTMVASFGLPGMSAYAASKAALELLTKVWAAEYGPQGVRVNAVAPGPTRTPGTEPMGDGIDQLAATLPLGRAASAEEIANTIIFLASDEASYVSGAILAVDGGRTAV
jgi:NAD(P)-dependent dehydrogenase (short-subunit alcohol dehydrogenase family)